MKRILALVLAAVVAVAALGVGYVVLSRIGTTTLTAYFAATTGLYAGDDVRVLGVRVGTIDSVEPQADRVAVRMTLDRGVKIPADAKAVQIAQSLVSARFVQLAPVYESGPTLADGDRIPLERTAVPVEWDDIKQELTRLSEALGPMGEDKEGSLGRFVNTTADVLDGNGDRLRETLRELSTTVEILSDGRDDLFGTLRNLQAFVSALAGSNEQIVQFGGRLATVSAVLADTSNELGAGLDALDRAVADVDRFLSANNATLGESVARLGDATRVLAAKRPELERVLHSAPTALVNFYQIYKPAQGGLSGAVVLSNFADPTSFLCGAVRGIQANDSDRSSDLCVQYLAPMLNALAMNYPPILVNPAQGVHAFPNQIVDSVPGLSTRATPRVVVPNGVSGLAVPWGGGR